MNKAFYGRIVLCLSVLIAVALFSCKSDNEDPDFKKGRNTYMSNEVLLKIVRPSVDTIYYKDQTSGFTMNIANGMLTTNYFDLGDTIRLKEWVVKTDTIDGVVFEKDTLVRVLKDLRVTLDFENFQAFDATGNFGFDGKGILYIKNHGQKQWKDTIPLIVLPVKGFFSEKTMEFRVAQEPGKEFKDSYVSIDYTGSRLR